MYITMFMKIFEGDIMVVVSPKVEYFDLISKYRNWMVTLSLVLASSAS